MRRRGCALFVMLTVLAAAPAQAQQPAASRRFGVHGFVELDRQAFTASDTFEAILDDTWGTFAGGGGRFRWRSLVFDVSVSRFRSTGERVFLTGGELFRLGIPTTITITPIEFTGAYRFRRFWRLVPYAGGGVGRQSYKETSRFAESDENVRATDTSYHVVGGAEVPVWRWIAAAVELRYRTVPDAIGKGGVSREYREDDLGGTSVRVKLLVGR